MQDIIWEGVLKYLIQKRPMGGRVVQIGFDAERISESNWKCL